MLFSRDDYGRVSFGKLDYVIQFLIIVSLIDFALETLPNLSLQTKALLKILRFSPL